MINSWKKGLKETNWPSNSLGKLKIKPRLVNLVLIQRDILGHLNICRFINSTISYINRLKKK